MDEELAIMRNKKIWHKQMLSKQNAKELKRESESESLYTFRMMYRSEQNENRSKIFSSRLSLYGESGV